MGRLVLGMALLAPISSGQLPVRDGASDWERVLNDVLTRAEQELQSKEHVSQRALPAALADTTRAPRAAGLHPIVQSFVRYFRSSGLKRHRAGVQRLQAYRPMIQRVLREEGLPPELIWVGLIESGYDPAARSLKNALGIWQLMPETATAFGLSVARRDERSDPEKSTRAAARYLKYLYAKFGDWALALAAYNAGERRVQSAIERARERDFWLLLESGLLPRETQAYVPAVLAAQFLGESPAAQEASSEDDSTTAHTAKVIFAPFSLSR